MTNDNGTPPEKGKGSASEEWLQALRELEDYDLKREERRQAATPRPVQDGTARTPTPLPRRTEVQRPETPRPAVTAQRPVDDGPEAVYEISLDETGTVRSEPATPRPVIEELERSEGAAKAPRDESTPRPSAESMARYDALRKKKSIVMKGEDIRVMEEMSDVVCTVNTATALLEEFRKQYGEAISEEKYNGWRNTLRDTSMVMLKEFHALRNGRQAKVYDKRNICSVCNTVFMQALPADRICDECRSRALPRGPQGD